MRHLRLLLLALPLTACVGSSEGDDKADDDEVGGEDEDLPTEAWSEHFYVESFIDAGGFTFDETYWARRTLDPVASTIEELFIAEADGTETLTLIEVDVDAGSFTLVINEGEYEGEGTLTGEAWAWTAWESVSTAGDGSYVVSSDEVRDPGIVSAKVGYGANDQQEWTLDEVLSTVTEAEYTAAVEELAR